MTSVRSATPWSTLKELSTSKRWEPLWPTISRRFSNHKGMMPRILATANMSPIPGESLNHPPPFSATMKEKLSVPCVLTSISQSF